MSLLLDRFQSDSRGLPERNCRVVRWVQGRPQFRFSRSPLNAEVQAKIAEHLAYLKRMAAEGVVPGALSRRAAIVWHLAWISAAGQLPIPAAATFSSGPIEYHWEVGPHQLSVEIPVEGPCHWFYRNKITGEVWGGEGAANELSPGIISHLKRLVASNR
jgi:hypothetical protein